MVTNAVLTPTVLITVPLPKSAHLEHRRPQQTPTVNFICLQEEGAGDDPCSVATSQHLEIRVEICQMRWQSDQK